MRTRNKFAVLCETHSKLRGWQVCEAETVRQGLIEAGTRKLDLVILDLGLPDRDGIDFILNQAMRSGV